MRLYRIILTLFTLAVFISSCTKETIIQDELTRNKNLHYGTWMFYQHEIENYVSGNLINKKVERFTDYTVEWKQDGTYIQNRNGSVQVGTWDLASPGVFVYDKNNATNERYYYIVRIDSNYYYRKGPFNKNGGLHRDFLTVEYYKK